MKARIVSMTAVVALFALTGSVRADDTDGSNVPSNQRLQRLICDSRLSGFTLRIQPSGVRSFYARFGRNRRFALGKADVRITRAVHALDMRASALTLRLRYFVTPTIAPLSF
jgi:hypothetical protein